MRLCGVLFDLDDTLVDSTGVEARVWLDVVEVIAEHHPGIDRVSLRKRYSGLLETHYAEAAAGRIDFHTFRRRRLADALSPWGEVDDELFARYTAAKDPCINDIRAAVGAIDTVRAVRATGVCVGVLTNGVSVEQRRKLEVAGLSGEVDVIAISGEIGAAKPDPAAFAAALSLLGTEPEETAMVGDSLPNDIEGARGAGLARVVWLHPHSEPPAGVLTATSLAQVPALLGLV